VLSRNRTRIRCQSRGARGEIWQSYAFQLAFLPSSLLLLLDFRQVVTLPGIELRRRLGRGLVLTNIDHWSRRADPNTGRLYTRQSEAEDKVAAALGQADPSALWLPLK